MKIIRQWRFVCKWCEVLIIGSYHDFLTWTSGAPGASSSDSGSLFGFWQFSPRTQSRSPSARPEPPAPLWTALLILWCSVVPFWTYSWTRREDQVSISVKHKVHRVNWHLTFFQWILHHVFRKEAPIVQYSRPVVENSDEISLFGSDCASQTRLTLLDEDISYVSNNWDIPRKNKYECCVMFFFPWKTTDIGKTTNPRDLDNSRDISKTHRPEPEQDSIWRCDPLWMDLL